MLKSRSKKKFRQEHSDEITLYEDARKFLKEKYPDGQFPSKKSLKEKREKLSAQQKAQHSAYTIGGILHFPDTSASSPILV